MNKKLLPSIIAIVLISSPFVQADNGKGHGHDKHSDVIVINNHHRPDNVVVVKPRPRPDQVVVVKPHHKPNNVVVVQEDHHHHPGWIAAAALLGYALSTNQQGQVVDNKGQEVVVVDTDQHNAANMEVKEIDGKIYVFK